MTSVYIECSCVESVIFHENPVASELEVLLCLELWKNKDEIIKITNTHNEVIKTVCDFNGNNAGKALPDFDVKMEVYFPLLGEC